MATTYICIYIYIYLFIYINTSIQVEDNDDSTYNNRRKHEDQNGDCGENPISDGAGGESNIRNHSITNNNTGDKNNIHTMDQENVEGNQHLPSELV